MAQSYAYKCRVCGEEMGSIGIDPENPLCPTHGPGYVYGAHGGRDFVCDHDDIHESCVPDEIDEALDMWK